MIGLYLALFGLPLGASHYNRPTYGWRPILSVPLLGVTFSLAYLAEMHPHMPLAHVFWLLALCVFSALAITARGAMRARRERRAHAQPNREVR